MTRFIKMKDWPTNLERMTRDELEKELSYWVQREDQLGHKDAKKSAFNNARTIRAVLNRRFAADSSVPESP